MVDTDLEHLSDADQMFLDGGGGYKHRGMDEISTMRRLDKSGTKARKAPITTSPGMRGSSGRAWVYVATDKVGRVKVGMTSDLKARGYGIQATMRLTLEVSPKAAAMVETEALRILRRKAGDGEWVPAPVDEVMAAVWRARDLVARSMCVDPSMSADDARLLRIGLAK